MTIDQREVSAINIGRASSGNVVLMQESTHIVASSVVIEVEALPRVIAALQAIAALADRTDRERTGRAVHPGRAG